jgi:DNA-binding GntR family transcriptional regulator
MPHPSLHVHVADALRVEIERGVLGPGERLVEMHVARRFGVSQGPVREALRLLEREGLVDHRPRRGVYVRALSAVDMEEIYSLRSTIEGLAARRAVQLMTPADHARIREALDAMEAARAGDATEYVEASLAFHEAIALTARHARLYAVWQTIASQTRRCAHLSGRFDDFEADALRHQALLEALDAGDAERAEAAMRTHIDDAGRALLRHAGEAGLVEQASAEAVLRPERWAALLRGEPASAFANGRSAARPGLVDGDPSTRQRVLG